MHLALRLQIVHMGSKPPDAHTATPPSNADLNRYSKNLDSRLIGGVSGKSPPFTPRKPRFVEVVAKPGSEPILNDAAFRINSGEALETVIRRRSRGFLA